MKVTGSAVLTASRDRVWAALNDPAVLVRTIPGCQRLDQLGPDAYEATVTAGVGSVKGVYSGEVKLADQQEPESFVLRAAGAGRPGTVQADVRVWLTESDGGGTRLDYDADAVVGGMIGGVGQRMLAGVAKKTADQFFAAVDEVLAGRTVALDGQAAGPPSFLPPDRPARPQPSAALVLAAAALGAAIALVSVLVGWLVAG